MNYELENNGQTVSTLDSNILLPQIHVKLASQYLRTVFGLALHKFEYDDRKAEYMHVCESFKSTFLMRTRTKCLGLTLSFHFHSTHRFST